MKLVAQLTLALWLGGGLLAWSGFCVRVYVRSELAPSADRTTRLVFYAGRGLLWTGALLAATTLLTAAASLTWRALGGS